MVKIQYGLYGLLSQQVRILIIYFYVGYGDFFPATSIGRLVIMCLSIYGTVGLSLLIVAFDDEIFDFGGLE